jgi:hypothetical protein
VREFRSKEPSAVRFLPDQLRLSLWLRRTRNAPSKGEDLVQQPSKPDARFAELDSDVPLRHEDMSIGQPFP